MAFSAAGLLAVTSITSVWIVSSNSPSIKPSSGGLTPAELLFNRYNGRIMNRPGDLRRELHTSLARLGYGNGEIDAITDTLIHAAFSGTDVWPKSGALLERLKHRNIGRRIAAADGSRSISQALDRIRPWSDEGKPIPKLIDLPYGDFDIHGMPFEPPVYQH